MMRAPIYSMESYMKRLPILMSLLMSVSATSLYAQDSSQPMLKQGNKELALSGTIEIPEIDEIDFDIDASYGYFFRDGWEIGVRAVGSDLGGIERFNFSAFTEYNFNRSSNVVPYIGTSVGVASVSFDGLKNIDTSTTLSPNDDTSTVFGVQAGVKWFIRPYMAISTSIGFDVSTDDIYLADDSLEDNLTRFRLGLRYYF